LEARNRVMVLHHSSHAKKFSSWKFIPIGTQIMVIGLFKLTSTIAYK